MHYAVLCAVRGDVLPQQCDAGRGGQRVSDGGCHFVADSRADSGGVLAGGPVRAGCYVLWYGGRMDRGTGALCRVVFFGKMDAAREFGGVIYQ